VVQELIPAEGSHRVYLRGPARGQGARGGGRYHQEQQYRCVGRGIRRPHLTDLMHQHLGQGYRAYQSDRGSNREGSQIRGQYEAHYLHTIVGPLPEAAARYRDRSPVNRADAITAPLLILQGDADKVVPPAQSRAIADRLQALGRTVELHLYEGEGHGWGRPATVIDELERTESFLRRHVLRWNP